MNRSHIFKQKEGREYNFFGFKQWLIKKYPENISRLRSLTKQELIKHYVDEYPAFAKKTTFRDWLYSAGKIDLDDWLRFYDDDLYGDYSEFYKEYKEDGY